MLLDIGVGILLGVFFDAFISNDLSLATYVLFGIFSALSPDFDFLFHLSKGGKFHNSHRHRELLHNPLVFIPTGSFIAYLIQPSLSGLFAAGAFSHMVHDSIGIGWGVRWLWPFTDYNYALGYRVRTGNHAKLPRQRFFIWPNKDIDRLSKEFGDQDWFRNTYLKWHPYAVFELGVFLAAVAALWLYTR